MSFGALETYQQMQKYFQKMRSVSRTELLHSLYKNDGKQPEPKVQQQIAQAFLALAQHNNYDSNSNIVQSILGMFDIRMQELEGKSAEDKSKLINAKIACHIREELEKIPDQAKQIEYQVRKNNPEASEFDWVGVKSNFPNLRGIFQQILLEKVKQFDDDLGRLTEKFYYAGDSNLGLSTTRSLKYEMVKPKVLSNTSRVKTISTQAVRQCHKQIDRKGFSNVLIRDHSEFALKKWTSKEEKQFQAKKNEFRLNFNKNGQQAPVIFQFVKKYTNTVKARDNIFQKWENRHKNGITPQQLKYLCSTSLFLNKSLNKSEKERLNLNIKALGKDLISKLEFNIAEKIIETYKQFMKKVADLRAHFYEQLTEKRKIQYSNHKQKQYRAFKEQNLREEFLKFKKIFTNICNSEKMKVILNPRVYRWVKYFMLQLKTRYQQKARKKLYAFQSKNIFSRLAQSQKKSEQLQKRKILYPSARVIKRQEIGTLKQPMKKYVPTDRFYYEKSYQQKIKRFNSKKVKSQSLIRDHLSGGPRKKIISQVTVNLAKRQIVLTNSACLKLIIKLQACWKAKMLRKKYLAMLQVLRQNQQKDFEERLRSLKEIYPFGKKINMKAIQDRLNRVSMRTLNVLKPYERVCRKPINNYTSFSQANFSLAELKAKQSKNSQRRLAQFAKMVEQNQFNKLMKSGFVVTAREINEPLCRGAASVMWWAVKNCNLDLTRIFLEGGGNPNALNQEGSTCLHEAMQNGDLQIIFLLLDYGADLNLKNNKKVTPLYFATPKMLKWLGLEQAVASCDQTVRDNNSLFFKPATNQQIYLQHYY